MSLPVTLTVRGTLVPKSLEAARELHNATAGSPQGIAAARSLGDLSHKVFAPCTRNSPGVKDGELLFLDVWCDPQGIQQFFSNPEVGKQGAAMFAHKDPTVWMPARGAYSYHLPPPRDAKTRFVGMLRGPIGSPEAAIERFAAADTQAVRTARKRGLISHELFIRVDGAELLALDIWSDEAGMLEQYGDRAHMEKLVPAFTGEPAASIWEQAPGNWSEW